jgi:glycosyltransferase involved in cell wall biosynthesis
LTVCYNEVVKIALVHDDLVQWGGAERMLVALSEIFPEAPIYTSVYNSDHPILAQQFSGKKIITSFIQKIPYWKKYYKAMLPLYPIAFEQFDFSEFDVVISQTTRFAKCIITKPGTKHICYCHTPPRFLWEFSGDQHHPLLKLLLSYLRIYDQVAGHRVDTWVAGSKNAQSRIKKVYGCDSQIIYPFVDMERFSSVEPFDGGYLLVISRLNKYKRVDLAVKAANLLKVPLKVIGSGPEEDYLKSISGSTVEMLGEVDESTLTMVIAGCQALIVSAEEDFGLTPLEAQAVGKPVIALKKGGALETVIEGETGHFFDDLTIESLIGALDALYKRGYNQKRCKESVRQFSREKFQKHFRSLVESQ